MTEPIPDVEHIMAPLSGTLRPEHYNRIYEVVDVLLAFGARTMARRLVSTVVEILEPTDGE